MFQQLNLKKGLISLSQFSLGDVPTEEQVGSLQSLGFYISKPFSNSDEHLLEALHVLASRESTAGGDCTPYSRTGEWWKYKLGFQHTDPVSDIRGGGVLALQNLVYILTDHPKLASQMLKSRASRAITQDAYASFPWACAGINLTRMLALEFEIIKPSGIRNMGIDAQYSKKTSWAYITAPDGFNRMYVCLFKLLDYFWDEMNATYMEFNDVLKAVSDEFKLHLALSTSLTNLENRVHKRIEFVDPDVCDYMTLPDPISAVDQELFLTSSRESNIETESSMLAIFTNHMPSYDDMMSNLVPAPAEMSIPNYDNLTSDHLMDHKNNCDISHHIQPSPYCMQIV
jgi:hypothetical protein